MILPAIVAWLFAAGYRLVRSKGPVERVRGYFVLGAEACLLLIFGLTCVLQRSRQRGAGARHFVDDHLDFLNFFAVGVGDCDAGRGVAQRAGRSGAALPGGDAGLCCW